MRGFRDGGVTAESKRAGRERAACRREFRGVASTLVHPVWQNARLPSTGLGGEIGRRAGLKIPFRKECRFDSDPRHQKPIAHRHSEGIQDARLRDGGSIA